VSDKVPQSSEGGAPASKLGRAFRFVRRHPARILQVVFFSLLAIIVLQNVEPTSIDVLFWSFAGLPKLVLILLSMAVGAAAWALASRWLRG